jgi:tetratricopeptide (TPR) repeat protein
MKFLSLVLILSACSTAWTQPKSPYSRGSISIDTDNLVTSIINETYSCDFDNALDKAGELIKVLPGEAEGYFYKGGVYKRMMEEGCLESNDSTMRVVKSLIDKACQLSERKCNASPDDVVAHFYYAASLVYRAWYESKSHDWIAVMSDGLKAKKLLEKTVEIDPDFYDAYAGIGAFNCYAARLPWYLKPFALVVGVSGDEDKGIEQLKKAAELGKYSRTEATLFLGSVVYPNREDYSNSIKLLVSLHREFPLNFYISQYLCKSYFELENYTQVIGIADTALTAGGHDGPCQRERLSFIQYFRGKAFEQLDKKDKAIADYEAIVRLDGERFAGRDAKAALERLKD